MAQPAFLSPSRRVIVALVGVAGVILSLVTWRFAATQQTERIHAGFLARAQTQATVAAQRLRNYEEMVYSLRDSFLGQNTVTRKEFANVAQSLLQRHAGVQALEWVQIVPHAQRAELEATGSAELRQPFVVRQRLADGQLVPAAIANEYFVINYVEPVAGNEKVLGYDIATAPTAALLRQARTDRQFHVSPAFRLMQSNATDAEPGISFILPFWRPEPGSPVEGWVQGIFHVQTMLAQSHQLTTNEALNTYYLDVGDGTAAPALLYANLAGNEPMRRPGQPVATPPLDNPNDFHFSLVVGGRQWRVIVQPNQAWASRNSSWQPHFMLLGGLACTALLVLFLHNLFERTQRIEHEVQERTRELRASETRLQDIVDHSPAFIFVKDLAGRHLLCNEIYAQLSGKPKAAILGRTDLELFGPELAAEFHRTDQQAIKTGKPVQMEQQAETAAGPITCYVQKFPLLDEQGRAYAICGIGTDITERKLAEEQKLVLERQLLESQKLESLGVLAGGIAHDFNNILTAILGNATLAGLEVEETHRVRHPLRQIENAARRAGDLCAQMLAYAGKASFISVPVNLTALVRDTAALLEVSVGKRVRLDLQVDPDIPAVLGDSTQLRQIVMNLVINAADAIGERTDGLIVIRTFVRDLPASAFATAVQSPALAAGRYVGLEVIDNGSGMAPELLSRIFEPFFTTKFSGRGLGLAAVLGIVQSHEGALFVDSQVGRGTTFRLFLPATNETPLVLPDPSPGSTSQFQGTVLIVDDEDPVRFVTARALQLLGLTVLEAASGKAALEIHRTHTGRIDLVLLDLLMPGISGEETLRRLRAVDADIRVIVASGYSEGETMQRCESLGVSGYLAKPFEIAALVEKVTAQLK